MGPCGLRPNCVFGHGSQLGGVRARRIVPSASPSTGSAMPSKMCTGKRTALGRSRRVSSSRSEVMARKTPNSHSMISKAAAVAIPPHQPADRGQVTSTGPILPVSP